MSEHWPRTGTLLANRYLLVALLDTGGMAEIWRARDEVLERPVAIKLPSDLPSRPDAWQLAWREAKMAARLSHPNIAAVHDYGESAHPEGWVLPFVVMELLPGESLAARVERAPLTWDEAARVAVPVADALAAAHAAGVVHRDIKPGNVMLTPTGVKILDFGISAVLGEPDDDETGATFGTPAYVAPERLDGHPAEPATDVYGLGVLLFEMVTGDPPYPVDTWEELAVARAAGPGELPGDLPPAFRDTVRRCLSASPDDRPGAAEVRTELAALAPEPETADEPPPSAYAPGRAPAATLDLSPAPRGRVVAGFAVAAAVLGILAVIIAVNAARDTTPSAAPSPAISIAPRETTAPPSPSPSPSPTLGFDDAVAQAQTLVEEARADGSIRDDVALDLLNLMGPLRGGDPASSRQAVDTVRAKVQDRLREGSLDLDQANAIRARLADIEKATS